MVFGLKNVHYAIATENAEGVLTYAAPVPLKGAVEISLEPRGETSDFYADDILYYTTVTNSGYEATLTVANITTAFRTAVLGEVLEGGADAILTENTNQDGKKIAFLFEFDGDVKAVRHCLYNCTVTRPSLTSATKTETAEPQPQELSLIAAPTTTGLVKRSTTDTTPAATYDAWYSAVYVPAAV